MTAFIQKKALKRRTFLQGMGAAIALPMLDAMAGALPKPGTGTPPPLRLSFVYVPNGVDVAHWTPGAEGAAFDLPYILEPLAPHRDRLLVLSGLTHNNARALGDGGGDHARAAAAFLTGVHPNKTSGADIHNGVSVDQIAAQALGHQTRFASLELTAESGRIAGDCDSGYSCAYSNSISWRSSNSPNPPESNPRQVFDRLFGRAEAATSPEDAEKRKRLRGSILDHVLDEAKRLQADLGRSDRAKLDEYLHSIRAVEKQIQFAEQQDAGAFAKLDIPEQAPEDYAQRARLMYDLQVLAFQTDQTRIISYMMALEGSNRAYREIGLSEGHHALSHHMGDEAKVTQIREINRYHMEQFAYFVEQLKNTPDGDGSLLDHSLIIYGSGISDGNSHNHDDLPVLVVGGASGQLQPGRHLRYADETPMANLYLNVLEYAGVPTEKLGDSTGKLEYLSW